MALCGAENWTLRAADQKYLGKFEMWCWRRMEKTSWTDHVRNEEVLPLMFDKYFTTSCRIFDVNLRNIHTNICDII
jgi:hypothetical protein